MVDKEPYKKRKNIGHALKSHANVTQFDTPKKARFNIALFSCPKGGGTMPEIILSDYFYGDESEEFIYFKIPRLLITDQKIKPGRSSGLCLRFPTGPPCAGGTVH